VRPRGPRVARSFGVGLQLRQTLGIGWDSFRTIARSWAGLALLVAVPVLAVLIVLGEMEVNGVPLVPTTARVVNILADPFTALQSPWVIIPLLVAFHAGELVWRERGAGLGDIDDAAPVPEWVRFLGRFLGLGLALALCMLLMTVAGMLAQAILGHRDVELGLYLTTFLGLQLVGHLLFALLALVVHVVVNQRYVGHLAAVLAYVLIAMAPMLGVRHDLLVYGAGPGWSYTEMRGFGASLAPWAWLKLYWAAWALLLAVVARLLWVRGREQGLDDRLRLARRRLTGPTAWTAAAAAALVVALGGWVYYDTNVLHDYRSAADIVTLRAEYERRYGRYADVPQPRLTGTRLRVEIHPGRREVEIHGTYRLVNRSAVPIDSIHLTTIPGVETTAVTFDRPATAVLVDDELPHRIYALAAPLQPGDSLELGFDVRVAPRGFASGGADASVLENGTYFTSTDWLPAIGYQRSRELTSAADRRAHGLPPRPAIFRPVHDSAARHDLTGREPIAFEAVVGTAEDQVAVAPGALRRSWTENGRRWFHYVTDAPIAGPYAIASARYAVHEARWKGVAIRIHHHPAHTTHLEGMVRGIRASLDHYTARYGPYPYGHLTVVERPGNGTGMHAEAGMLTHEEGFASWSPGDEPGSLDHPFAIVAHEMAHQWWGTQLAPANVEGGPVLSESLAWYSALQVVRASRGEEELQRLLGFMRQPSPYPPIRRGEPLLRAMDPYLAYRKGPFALHALGEYLGTGRVDAALRRLLETHGSGAPPLATTLDLYRELRAVAPDSLQYLLHDLFAVNTVWELEMEHATAEETGDGGWRVTLDVTARKVVIDSAGVETTVPMDEWVPIGVFARAEAGAEELSRPLHVGLHRIRAGQQTITVTVPQRPALAGIDPHHLLDWVAGADDDNIVGVRIVGGERAGGVSP
jgi:ABC-2 type transport system permease protein